MKNTIMALAVAFMLGGAGLTWAQQDTENRARPQQTEQNEDLRDAPAAQQQQRQMQRPPVAPDQREAVPADQRNLPAERRLPADGAARSGGMGLIIAGVFLALIVFVLFRRGKRTDTTHYNKP